MTSIKLFGLLFFWTACTSRTNNVEGKFIQSGYNDYRSYEFRKDGTFEFKNELGFSDKRITGTYIISQDIIFLNPDTDFLDRDLMLKLKVINSDCIRDYDNIFYCTDSLTCEKLNATEYKFQEKTTSILDTLQEVREEREHLGMINQKYLKNNPKQVMVSDIPVHYRGIVVVDRRELHLFEYVKVDTIYSNPLKHSVRLLVHKKPFEIYRLYNFDDSLRLIYKERE